MTQVEWHLDVAFDAAGDAFLLVFNPAEPMFKRLPIKRAGRNEIVSALLDLMRTVPQQPAVIVTDRAQTWSSIARLVGGEHRLLTPGQMSLCERLVRNGSPGSVFAEAQRKFQTVRADRAETRAERLEQLLRQMLGAQMVQPYRGWDITALNRAVNDAREFLGLPSIRELNPSIAKMQDAAIANGLGREPRP